MTFLESALYGFILFDSFAGIGSLYMLLTYVILPKIRFKKNLTLKEDGMTIIADVHLFDRKQYQGTYTNLNLTSVLDDTINRITGTLPKHDLESVINQSVENAVNRQIATIIEKSMDKDLMNNLLVERINKAINDYFKKDAPKPK